MWHSKWKQHDRTFGMTHIFKMLNNVSTSVWYLKTHQESQRKYRNMSSKTSGMEPDSRHVPAGIKLEPRGSFQSKLLLLAGFAVSQSVLQGCLRYSQISSASVSFWVKKRRPRTANAPNRPGPVPLEISLPLSLCFSNAELTSKTPPLSRSSSSRTPKRAGPGSVWEAARTRSDFTAKPSLRRTAWTPRVSIQPS